MTREAVSAAKPAVRAQAKTEKVHGAASAAVLKGLVYGAAVLTFAVLLFLIGYILVTGIPHLKPSLFQWNYTSENVSMMPAILTTVETTALALLLAVPLGLFTAVYLNEYAKRGNKLVNVIRITTETLSGIPSIVYGFFGLVVLVPFIREHFKNSNGQSILCASILLGIMILPTIIGASEPTIRAVEQSYYEGALALGATHERSVFTVVVPAAKSGILAGVGRALGETMAVMMVVGNQPRVPNSILQGVRTLTTNIVMEMGYATDLHREALIATGVVLFAFILIINLCFSAIKRSGKE